MQDEKTAPASEADNGKVPAYSWYVLFTLVVVYILNFIDRQIMSILAVDIKAHLALDDAQLGFLGGAAFAVFYALFGVPLGRLADRWHRVRLLTIGLALWSAMTAASGLARNFFTLSLARMGVGIGEATASPTAYSLISDYFPAKKRATALAIYSSGLYLGGGVSLLIGAKISKVWDAAYNLAFSVGAQEQSCDATSRAPCSPCRNWDRLQEFMCSQNSSRVFSSIAR